MLQTKDAQALNKAKLKLLSPENAVEMMVVIFGSQEGLAEEIGVKQQTISKWVNGILKISPAKAVQLEKIARARGLYEITRQKLRPDFEW